MASKIKGNNTPLAKMDAVVKQQEFNTSLQVKRVKKLTWSKIQGKEYTGPEIDVWSLGIILYKLVSGVLPFDGQSLSELREQVIRGSYRVPYYMSSSCELLLKKMIRVEPSKRNNIQIIMNDTWVNFGYENDLLRPYVEPKKYPTDPRRFDALIQMGYTVEAIVKSLKEKHFNAIHAAYLLTEGNATPKIRETTNGRPSSPINSSSESKEATTDPFAPRQPRVNFHQDVAMYRENGGAGKEPQEPPLNGTTEPDKQVKTELPNGGDNKPRVIVITRSKTEGNTDGNGTGHMLVNSYEPKLNNDNGNDKPKGTAYLPNHIPDSINYNDFRTVKKPPGDKPQLEQQPIRHNFPVRSNTVRNKKTDESKVKYTGGHEITIGVGQNVISPIEDGWKDNIGDACQFSRYTPIRQTVHVTRCADHTKRNPVEHRTPDKLSVVGKARINLFKLDESETSTTVLNEEVENVSANPTFVETIKSTITRNQPPDDQYRPLNTTFQPDKHIQTQVTPDYSWLSKADVPSVVTASPCLAVEEARKGSNDLFNGNGEERLVYNEPIASSSNKSADKTGSPRGFSLIRTWTARIKKRSGSKSSHGSNSIVAQNSPRLSHYNDDKEHTVYIDPLHANGFDAKSSSGPSQEKMADGGASGGLKRISQSKLSRAATVIEHSPREQMPIRVGNFFDDPVEERSMDAFQDQTKPRALKFSMFVKNTSRRPLEEIQPEIKRTLSKNACRFEQATRFLFICESGSHNQRDFIKFEVEICTLGMKNCYAIHYKKVSGEYLHYRNLIARISKEMSL